jgi:hypothetical protein
VEETVKTLENYNKGYTQRTAVQKHLGAGWQGVHTSFDSFKALIIGYGRRRPSTAPTKKLRTTKSHVHARHLHQAMLEIQRIISQNNALDITKTHRNPANDDIGSGTTKLDRLRNHS